MPDHQAQRAGDHAQQMQIAGDAIVVQGITERQAKEIALEAAKSVLAEYTEEAREAAFQRVDAFTDELIERLSQTERLSAFKDPAFQVVLRKAEFGAASSERTSDYELLARLLDDRAERDERPVRAAINRAVEIVDSLDEEALTGLTVANAVFCTPTAGHVAVGLDALDRLFGELLVSPLPAGDDWLDHLDTLDAVRVSTAGVVSLKKLPQICGEAMPGYISVGVDADRDTELQGVLGELGVDMPSVPHELKEGYRRLPFVSESVARTAIENGTVGEQEKRDRLLSIALEDYGVAQQDSALVGPLGDEIDKRDALAAVRRWWDSIPQTFSLTGVGRVLARANAKRRDHAGLLPDLD